MGRTARPVAAAVEAAHRVRGGVSCAVGPGPANDDLEQVACDAVETCTAPAPPSGKPKLDIRKRASKDTARLGEVISYRITVRNKGEGEARRVRVCDLLPAGQKPLDAPGADKRGSERVCWTIKRLAAGAKKTFRIVTQVKLGAKLGEQRNKAVVKAANAKRARSLAGVRVVPTADTCPSGFKRC